jgi:hypothetical protein
MEATVGEAVADAMAAEADIAPALALTSVWAEFVADVDVPVPSLVERRPIVNTLSS